MRKYLMRVFCWLLILALLPAATLAQPGGGGPQGGGGGAAQGGGGGGPQGGGAAQGGARPAPSGSGGNVGGPGMSGAAIGAGTQGGGGAPQAGGPGGGDAPQAGGPGNGGPDGGGPGGGGPGNGGPGGGGPGGGGPGGGDAPQAGGPGNGGPGNGGPGGNPVEGLLGADSPLVALLEDRGGGFPALTGEGGLLERFGSRGPGNITLPFMENSPFSRDTFAATIPGANFDAAANVEGTPWRPAGADSSIPASPSALEDVGTLTEAQDAAEAAVAAAEISPSEAANQAADEATQNAQNAYDQVWADYYEAVDYTAATYYDTVTASYDYLLQTYEEAVDYTSEAVDYYYQYAQDYAEYCAGYPWDCYSYSYDASTNTYVYVGDVSISATSSTTVGEVAATTSVTAVAEPTPSAEAYEAIVVFANDQLGAVVEPLYAGELTAELQIVLQNLPAEIQAYTTNMTSIAGDSYYGLLNGGVAAVAVGDCTTGNCTVTDDNLSTQLSSASAGTFGIMANAAMPTTADEALALITQVYPKLEGLAFAQITDIDAGLAFTATAAGVGYDASTGQPASVAKVVYAGVVNINGVPLVYALVAVGEGYVSLLS